MKAYITNIRTYEHKSRQRPIKTNLSLALLPHSAFNYRPVRLRCVIQIANRPPWKKAPPKKRPQAAGKTTVDPEVILPRARCEPMCGLISVTLFGLYQMKRVRTERDERSNYPLPHYWSGGAENWSRKGQSESMEKILFMSAVQKFHFCEAYTIAKNGGYHVFAFLRPMSIS